MKQQHNKEIDYDTINNNLEIDYDTINNNLEIIGNKTDRKICICWNHC